MPGDVAMPAYLHGRGQEEVGAGAAAEVDDGLARRAGRARSKKWPTPAKDSTARAAELRVEQLRVVAEPQRHVAAHLEVEVAAGIVRHGAVHLLDAPLEQRRRRPAGWSPSQGPCRCRRRRSEGSRTVLSRLPRRDRPVDLQGLRRPGHLPRPDGRAARLPDRAGVSARAGGAPGRDGLRAACGRRPRHAAVRSLDGRGVRARHRRRGRRRCSTSGWSAPRCSTGRSARAGWTAG